ncbi:MAG: hypothetical protein LBV32_10195 [Tannerellaceae bacterium]|jgi:hypothetical protein|nr:hypothetical protein [Tannerellaceae bacterium]
MKEDNKYMEELLERFFNGETSNAEEQELYALFESGELPEHLLPYKPVFDYFKSGLAEEVESSAKISEAIKPLRPPGRRYLTVLLTAAAVILMFFLLKPLLHTEPDPFEGSYIVRNGVRIDDLEQIRPELELKMQTALLQQEKANRLWKLTNETEDAYTTVEQEIKATYCDIIHRFPDENIREEIKDMLQIECDY